MLQTSPFHAHAEALLKQSGALLNPLATYNIPYADLYFEQVDTGFIRASKSGPGTKAPRFHVKRGMRSGVALRAVLNGTQYIDAVEEWSPAQLLAASRKLVDKVPAAQARAGLYSLPDHIEWQDSLPVDQPASIDLEEKKYLLNGLLDAAFSYAPDLASCVVEYRDFVERHLVLNTEGVAVASAHARLGIHLSVVDRFDHHCYAVVGRTGGFGMLAFADLEFALRKLLDQLQQYPEVHSVTSSALPIVFEAGNGSLWAHEMIGHLLEGDVDAGVQAGMRIGPDQLTVHDDPTLEQGQGSYAVDDEGTPSHRTPIVEGGRVASLLMDRCRGMEFGKDLTGNGRRASYTDPVLPRMSNLVVAPGDADTEALIGSVQHGLYVRQVSSGKHHGDGNVFDLHIRDGNLISSGRLSHRIQNVVVSGNCQDALQQIRGIGNAPILDGGMGVCEKQGQIVPVSIKSPAVLIDGLMVRQV